MRITGLEPARRGHQNLNLRECYFFLSSQRFYIHSVHSIRHFSNLSFLTHLLLMSALMSRLSLFCYSLCLLYSLNFSIINHRIYSISDRLYWKMEMPHCITSSHFVFRYSFIQSTNNVTVSNCCTAISLDAI